MIGEMVPVTQPPTWMTNPSWFLVTGLPWPEDKPSTEIVEAALAIAPYVTQVVRPVGPDGEPLPLGRDFALMLDAGSRCAAALGKRVLFLSDITRWLAGIGLSWERIGVSFEYAQEELEGQKVGLYLTVSQRAYSIVCSAARTSTIQSTSGSTAEVLPEDREQVRAQIEAALDADWPDYVARAIAGAQPAA
jgi:hypothetical protein